MPIDAPLAIPDPGAVPLPPPPPRWSAAVSVRSGRTTLTLGGELDLACAVRLDRALRRLDKVPGRVEVDLGAVTFADSHGVRPLLDASRRRRDGGVRALRLASVSPAVRWVLDLVGSTQADRPDIAMDLPPRPRGSA
jgi:anti-sigma B factor antagonist